MFRVMTGLVLCCALAACGGPRGGDRGSSKPVTLFATGPIQQACQKAGRKQASRARCGCVQAVANMSLSANDQRKGATFSSEPQRAQDVRQSDNAANERFWDRWVEFGTRARKLCTA